MTKRVVLVRHGDDPDDDRVVTHLKKNGYAPDVRKPFMGDLCGDVTEDLAGTVFYGGPYNVYETDKHPFLNEEYRWMAECLKADVPILGLCQGAQMLAWHHGAWAGARPDETYEFGYYEVRPTADAGDFLTTPHRFTQAHYHTFDLPPGAVHLAESDEYPNQAFRLGDKVYGLQFHPEQTVESFRRWQNAKKNSYGKPGAQTREEQNRLAYEHDEAQADWFFGFLDKIWPKTA